MKQRADAGSAPMVSAARAGQVAAALTATDLPGANRWLGFLADDERATGSGAQVAGKVHALLSEGRDLESLFTACNMLALLLFRQGRLTVARDLCRREIGFALRQSGRPCWPLAAFLLLQPQINLLRLDGFAGDADRALQGLAALEQVAHGQPATLPDLRIDERMLAAMTEAGHPAVNLARSVCIVDTCKILWRRRRWPELVAEAGRLKKLWPDLAWRGGPQHAEEAAWLVHPLELQPPSVVSLGTSSLPRRRLGFTCLLHVAGAAAETGALALADDLATGLFACRDLLAGPYASPLTPARCLASLGDTLLRLGRLSAAATVLGEVLETAQKSGDWSFRADLLVRLAATAPAVRDVPEPRAGAHEAPGHLLDDALFVALERLDGDDVSVGRSGRNPMDGPSKTANTRSRCEPNGGSMATNLPEPTEQGQLGPEQEQLDPEVKGALNLARKVRSAMTDQSGDIEGHSFEEDTLDQNVQVNGGCACA